MAGAQIPLSFLPHESPIGKKQLVATALLFSPKGVLPQRRQSKNDNTGLGCARLSALPAVPLAFQKTFSLLVSSREARPAAGRGGGGGAAKAAGGGRSGAYGRMAGARCGARPRPFRLVGVFLGVESSSILFSHRSFQKPDPFPQGFGWFSRKKDPWKEWRSYP